LHKAIGFPPKLEITNFVIIHKDTLQKSESFSISFKHIIARMSSLSKVVEDEVQSFLELMFPSFKVSRGSRDEDEATLQSEQGLGHMIEANSSQDCGIQTSVQDQLT
jgi:hypothetical protein